VGMYQKLGFELVIDSVKGPVMRKYL
jgi:hypothetical protein